MMGHSHRCKATTTARSPHGDGVADHSSPHGGGGRHRRPAAAAAAATAHRRGVRSNSGGLFNLLAALVGLVVTANFLLALGAWWHIAIIPQRAREEVGVVALLYASSSSETTATTATALGPAERLPLHRTASDVAVFVLSRRDAFDTREAVRDTWAAGHDNVYFVVGGSSCDVPPSYLKEDWTCELDDHGGDEDGHGWRIGAGRGRGRGRRGPSRASMERHARRLREEEEDLAREQRAHGDMIFTDDVDLYRNLPKKLKVMYDFTARHLPDVRWIVKTDDDFVVRVDTLAEYLRLSYNSTEALVVGNIQRKVKAQTRGKWREIPQWPEGGDYPPFPLGSNGHVVSRPVAEYIANHGAELVEYQGEDVSLGIWVDRSPLQVNFVTSQAMTNGGDCGNSRHLVIGHNFSPQQMRSCFEHSDEVDVPRLVSQPLEFVHITATGARLVERAGAEAGMIWGACHYRSFEELKCDSPDRIVGANIRRDEGMRIRKDVSEWHLPIKYCYSNPYGDTPTFTIVRNPYDRIVREYHRRDDWQTDILKKKNSTASREGRTSPAALNRWVQYNIKVMMSKYFTFSSGHLFPQYDYVYHENHTKAVLHVLHYESVLEEFPKLMKSYNLTVAVPAILPPLNTYGRVTAKDLSVRSVALINRYYSRDFRSFGYEKRNANFHNFSDSHNQTVVDSK